MRRVELLRQPMPIEDRIEDLTRRVTIAYAVHGDLGMLVARLRYGFASP